MRHIVLTLIFAAFGVLPGAAAPQVNYVPVAPEVLMPDGSAFKSWADSTRYTKTYHVNRNHSDGSDENVGTEQAPFRTINKAAQVAKAGERVLIHAGVYREMVQPLNSGEGPDRMISYEAVPGDEVVVKGSRLLQARWEISRDAHGKGSYSRRLWMATLPDSLFAGGYFPFRTPNASDEDLDLMPWALTWKGRIPYSLPRGLIFQEGRRMTQLATYEDLVRLPGSYWVAGDGRTVHIHPFGSGDPNGQVFEVAVQNHIFKPANPGLGFIRVSGLILEQCANGFPRVGVGALFTMGGHHWIIERNTVRQVNSVGIEIGYRTFESADKRQAPRRDPNLGHVILRNNRIYDCGTAGVRAHDVSNGLLEGNEITNCGWQDAEYHWEVAGIKLLVTRGTLVRDNHISRIEGGGGIWLDWDNRGSRVTRNLIHDVRTAQGAVFVEASQQPNLVDHNVIWNISGQGVRAADTDNLTVAHNLFIRVSEDLVFAKVATNRSLGGRRLTSRGNRVLNNIFVDTGKPNAFDDADNLADFNIYVSTAAGSAAKRPGTEPHSIAMNATLSLNDFVVDWKPAHFLPGAPPLKFCGRDFFERARGAELTVPGPFEALSRAATVRLPRTPAGPR